MNGKEVSEQAQPSQQDMAMVAQIPMPGSTS